MSSPGTLDIGGNHTLTPVFDRLDRLTGYIHTHPDPQTGMSCQGVIAVRGDIDSELYRVVEADPLTLSPAVRCKNCGAYGYIRAGQWIPITIG